MPVAAITTIVLSLFSFIQHTLRALCAVADTHAQTNPIASKVGAFQEAMPMPHAMGSKLKRAYRPGKA